MLLIIGGYPATGKTTIANKMQEEDPTLKVIHTDDYMEHGYKESIYVILDEIVKVTESGCELLFDNIVIEGIMGSRLVRKMEEVGVDHLITEFRFMTASEEHIRDVYFRERPDKNFKSILSSMKGLDTVNESITSTKINFVGI